MLAERFARDASKWATLRGAADSAAAAGVVADIVLIDDHDDTSRVYTTESDGSRTIAFQSHLKICRLTRLEDGKYSLASVSPSVPVVTNESDASASLPIPDHFEHSLASFPLPRVAPAAAAHSYRVQGLGGILGAVKAGEEQSSRP